MSGFSTSVFSTTAAPARDPSCFSVTFQATLTLPEGEKVSVRVVNWDLNYPNRFPIDPENFKENMFNREWLDTRIDWSRRVIAQFEIGSGETRQVRILTPALRLFWAARHQDEIFTKAFKREQLDQKGLCFEEDGVFTVYPENHLVLDSESATRVTTFL